MRCLSPPLAFLAVAVAVAASGCDSTPSTCEAGTLGIEDVRVGTGDTATADDSVRVDYVGTLENGREFADRTNQRVLLRTASPLGFRDGVVGMRENGQRRLTLPPNFAFGPSGDSRFGIPPCATLTFEVRLIEVIR